MKIAIIGQHGSGKTTLAHLLGGIFNMPHISSGDLARTTGFADSDAEKTGKLDPDEEKIRKLVREATSGKESYILDGFPRMIEQIDNLEIPIDVVLYLDISTNPTVGKTRLLQRNRPDDTPDIISARMYTYHKYSAPLVSYFDRKKKLLNIDATSTIAYTLRQAVVQMAEFGILEVSAEVDRLIKEFEHGKPKRVYGRANKKNKQG